MYDFTSGSHNTVCRWFEQLFCRKEIRTLKDIEILMTYHTLSQRHVSLQFNTGYITLLL